MVEIERCGAVASSEDSCTLPGDDSTSDGVPERGCCGGDDAPALTGTSWGPRQWGHDALRVQKLSFP